ncbi:MAG: DUF2384 domain-containing protein, partial [Candidatus Eremiobacteraeota bacterium]|nr:DUF2384 domain-containing protein [Candidatus Eremiobacteraeota bacterium]
SYCFFPNMKAFSNRSKRLSHVRALARHVFGSDEVAEDWLKTPNRVLRGEKPIDLLDSDARVEQVVRLLGQIEYGVYS